VLEEQGAAGTRRPLQCSREIGRRRRHVANPRSQLDCAARQSLGLGPSRRTLPIQLGARSARLRDPELRCVEIVASSLERALRLEPLLLFLCTLDELLGLAGRPRCLVERSDRGALVRRALRERRRQGDEEGCSGGRVGTQLVDLRLQRFHARQRLRDVGVAALELFGERQQRFQRRVRFYATSSSGYCVASSTSRPNRRPGNPPRHARSASQRTRSSSGR